MLSLKEKQNEKCQEQEEAITKMDILKNFNATNLKVLRRGKPARGYFEYAKNALRNLPKDIYILFQAPADIFIADVIHTRRNSKNLKQVGSYERNSFGRYPETPRIIATTKWQDYYINKDEFLSIIFHELGHTVASFFDGYDCYDYLSEFIEKDAIKLSIADKKRFNYFFDEQEMWAETFAYFLGSKSIMGLSRKDFQQYFPNTITEVDSRLKTLIKEVENLLNHLVENDNC